MPGGDISRIYRLMATVTAPSAARIRATHLQRSSPSSSARAAPESVATAPHIPDSIFSRHHI